MLLLFVGDRNLQLDTLVHTNLEVANIVGAGEATVSGQKAYHQIMEHGTDK